MLKKLSSLVLVAVLIFSCALAAGETPEAVVREGTLIVRIPETWLRERMDDGTLSGTGWSFGDIPIEVPLRKLDVLFGYAHLYLGSRNLDFVADCMDGRAAPVNGYWALAYPGEALNVTMAQQYADGAWYTVTRLDGGKELPDKLFCDGTQYRFDMEDGVMRMEGTVWDSTQIDADIVEMNDLEPVFERDGLSVFEVFDRYLAVLTQKDTDDKALWSAAARINGEAPEIVMRGKMSGYRNGRGDAVYCLFITEEEFETLKSGANCVALYDPF